MKDLVRIGIVGSRLKNEPQHKGNVKRVLLALMVQILLSNKKAYKFELVSGGCRRGADRFAEELSEELNIPIKIHYPDKSKLDKQMAIEFPRGAYAEINYARNKLIAQDSDYLIAYVADDRKGGTENTIKHFKEFGKEKNLILVEG